MIVSVSQQGSKAVLVSRLVAAAASAAAAPAPAAAAAPAPAPTAPSAAPAAAPAAAVPSNQSTAPSGAVNFSATAADDEAARLKKRMEKFGTVASAPAAAVSDAEAERIKKRGSFLLYQPAIDTHSPDTRILICCRGKVRHGRRKQWRFQGRRGGRGAKKGALGN
jgi:hypothetical protein